MSFFAGDLQFQQQQQQHSNQFQQHAAPILETSNSNSLLPSENDNRKYEGALAFGYQFAEVENAIANFTKHQPFNHHYAPNVHVNRNHNHNHNHNHNNHNHNNHHHHHNNKHNHNSNNGNNNNNSNNSSNNNNNNSNNSNSNGNSNNNNMNNGRFQQQGQPSFALNAQLKQQQQQQFMLAHSNPQQIARFKQFSQQQNFIQHQSQQVQQQQPQRQQVPQQVPQPQFNQQFQQQVPQTINGYVDVDELNYDAFQQQPHLNHPDLLNNLRNNSPTLSAPIRPSSVSAFGAPLEQISSGSSSFGLSGSDLMNSTPLSASSSGDFVDKKLSLDDSTNAYLGDIWGNPKYTSKNSTSVWA